MTYIKEGDLVQSPQGYIGKVSYPLPKAKGSMGFISVGGEPHLVSIDGKLVLGAIKLWPKT